MARLKGRDRRLGWEPPIQINVKVAHGSYKYIQGVADMQQRNCPFYSTLESIIREYHQLKQDLEQNEAFLALAIDDKKALQRENDELKERLQEFKIDISIKTDSPAIILADRREEQVKHELDTEFRKWDL